MKHLFTIILTIFIFSGCTVAYKDVDLDNKNKFTKNINKLYTLIKSVSKKINESEAKSVSFEAIEYSKYLANEYQIVAPALFHNTLVNMGIKQKGYCYHYANDLLKYLKKQHYKSFYFIRAISKRGEYFEHSSIVLTRNDIDFENSIVLDAWRDEGKLYFSKVKDDKKYEWEKK